MSPIDTLIRDRVLLMDGGMGTQIFARKPTVEDYGGAALEGCVEWLNVRRPEWIRAIHQDYFDAGADAVETNTFGCNALVLAEFGLEDKSFELNVQAARLAREVADSYARPRFVVGSVGPGTKLLTLGHVGRDAMYASYLTQVEGLIEGGADAILVETCQDLGQMKVAVRAAKAAMAARRKRLPLWVQATVETTGTLLVGSDIQAVRTTLASLGIDVLGLNCATGPEEMAPHLAHLAEASPVPISCLPNAGLPRNENGQVVYPLGPEAFAEKVAESARRFGIQIVGGCCGTTPAHIRALSSALSGTTPTPRKPEAEPSVASLYQSVSLHQEPRPLIVGERTNANGSKKFRELLAAEDFEALADLAKEQEREGAHLLDVCVAYVGRDEVRDMDELLRRVVTRSTLPLMIDSTEVPVIQRALEAAPGRCVVNSINFEDGEAKARAILDLCREHGAAVVALTIDERGMAKTLEQKLEVAQRLFDLVVGEYGFAPADLIIDPLTFTLGSGDEEFRKSAVATVEAIRAIKARFPGVLTILGVSNVSFGLPPALRPALNSVMLHHAVAAGLDLAIFNAAKVIPLGRLDAPFRQQLEDLVFDARREDYDPLKELLASGAAALRKDDAAEDLPIEARLHKDVLEGRKAEVPAHIDTALETLDPLDLLNRVLLGAMKDVGERFGRGEIPLPFVLESAEAMKAAIRRLEPHMPKDASTTKGRVLLATVKGDVHDIGKNLVEIILSNNGYEVENLGIKQPVEAILAALEARPADALGLSGLLVKSTVVMKDDLEVLAAKGLKIPVLLGGAALTRDYVEGPCRGSYPGPVLYAEDAFEGLRHLDALLGGHGEAALPRAAGDGFTAPAAGGGITIVRRGDSTTPLSAEGQSTWVRPQERLAQPPFWGARTLEHGVPELFDWLDTFVVLRNRWGFTQGALSDEAFAEMLRDKAEPELAAWRARLESEPILRPRAAYGYFPANADRDGILVYDPADPEARRPIASFDLPRQANGRRLCIADFLAPVESGRIDVLALQVVSLGPEAARFAAELYGQDRFGDYFKFHGLATELTEAYAELVHARVRRELDAHHRDAKELRQLFSQGYQGSRYSFGYPACPDLEGNAPLLRLLDAGAVGVTLTETFQMEPEYATSALVVTHPQARYFAV